MFVLSLLTLLAGVFAVPHDLLGHHHDARTYSTCTMNWGGNCLTGVQIGDSCRYTVRYGTAERWGFPSATSSQHGQKASEYPPKCPQSYPLTSGVGTTAQSEDCLFTVVYTPANISSNCDASPKLPVLVWVHGGSNIIGSASDLGMDGTQLAPRGNMIVVFVQYRLGALGFLPPGSAATNTDPNLAARDVILALQSVHDNIRSAGGDRNKVTIGGQSSGASLIKTLLGSPAAQGLYHKMILQSDPGNIGTQLADQRDRLQELFYGHDSFANCADFDCLKNLPVETILSVQGAINNIAPSRITGIPLGETFRPQSGTNTIPNDPSNLLMTNTSDLSVDIANVPILFTTTRNEAGGTIQTVFPNVMPAVPAYYAGALNNLLSADRTPVILSSGHYPLSTDTDGLRTSIERVATDAGFRCVAREFARRYASAGGKVWVAEWGTGAFSIFNSVGYCRKEGMVCHSDDIYPAFGTTPAAQATAETQALESRVRQSWVSFISNGTPAPTGVNWPSWTATSTDSDVYLLGEGGVTSCPVDFWGNAVKWDFQVYSLTNAWESNTATPTTGPISSSGTSTVSAIISLVSTLRCRSSLPKWAL